jgi:metal-responsive CopG/Arc/MetJ family transcriptional regulator
MKTAISVPDNVFAEADHLAKKLSKSRSQLYTEAMVEYLHRHQPDTVTSRLNEVWDRLEGEPDRLVSEGARRTLKEIEW